MNIQKTPAHTSFGALHIANCGDLKLYRLEKKYNADKLFLSLLPTNVDMEGLMPGLKPYDYHRWREMLVYAITKAYESKNTTYIETYKGVPCGIITFKVKKSTELDCICTWPVEFGKKVSMAGKALFLQMFKDFEALKEQKIILEAITDGPFNPAKKYKQLGFQPVANLWSKVKMEADAKTVRRTSKQLNAMMDYKEVKPRRVNLCA